MDQTRSKSFNTGIKKRVKTQGKDKANSRINTGRNRGNQGKYNVNTGEMKRIYRGTTREIQVK